MEKHIAERYPVELRWSDEDCAFLAEVYDLPGCMADGETEEEAVKAAHVSARLWIEEAARLGRQIPPPSTYDASGKFNVRLPASVHRELQQRARREGVSLNQMVTMLLVRRAAETETVGPYQIHKTMESAVLEAQSTPNCYVVVDRSVAVKHGLNFLPPPWRYHAEDKRTGAVFFEHPEHVRVGMAILDR